jgi:hypothetical protein
MKMANPDLVSGLAVVASYLGLPDAGIADYRDDRHAS